MRIELWAAALLCVFLCVLVCALVTFKANRRARRTLMTVQQELDNAISGNMQAEIYDESLDGAILERLNHLVKAADMQRSRALRERDQVMALISNITHQVRTPLSNIMLYGGLLQEQAEEGEAAMLAAKILGQAEKMEFFMKELVRTSYAEQEMIKMRPEKLSPDDLIAAACQNAELSSMKKGIVIRQLPLSHQGVRQEKVFCLADKKWTVEALDNLLDNGIKYAPACSEITVEAVCFESFVCIQVRDQGPGIPEEEQAKIFARFYRSPSSLQTPGFGIGLYLVREIIGREGGYVRLKSSPGQGSAFSLYLPRYRE